MTNVVLVIMDDMRRDLLPYMPFVNGTLRPQGTELAGMRCEVPICSPARASIITGRHARDPENGVYAQPDPISSPSTHALPVWLAPVTASNGMFGKYMVNGSSGLQPGWDRWCVMNSNVQGVYDYSCKDETGAVVTPGVTSSIHQLKYLQSMINPYLSSATEPFFCYFAPTNPHVNDTEFRNNPWPETCSKFGWVRWPMTHLLSDADAATKPSFRAVPVTQYTETQLGYLNNEIRNQIRECFDVDTVIKSMWDTLVARGGGVLGRTIWIFATDSGVFYEEQRTMVDTGITVSQKGDCYDCVTRVPSLIMGPGIPVGLRDTTPMTMQDITPTICNIFGATPSLTLRGTDIRTLVTNPPADRDTLYECKSTAMPWDATGIVTRTRKLVKYAGKTGNDQYEMYDLDTDPWENTSVANVPGRLTERNALETRMNAIA